MKKTMTVLLCGVGGQGTILAADLLAKTAAASGMQVKLSEIHGMSQRGGSVTTVVRFGDTVESMMCDKGCADCLVSFESIEALRNLPYLAPDGALLVNDEAIPSLPVQIGLAQMPQHINDQLLQAGGCMIPASKIAQEMGNPKGPNVVLMGALATQLPFDLSVWTQVIRERVPQKTIDANIASFNAGYEFALNG